MGIVWEYLCYVGDNALRRLANQGTAEWPERVVTIDFGPVRFLQHAPDTHRGLIALVAVCLPPLAFFMLRAALHTLLG